MKKHTNITNEIGEGYTQNKITGAYYPRRNKFFEEKIDWVLVLGVLGMIIGAGGIYLLGF